MLDRGRPSGPKSGCDKFRYFDDNKLGSLTVQSEPPEDSMFKRIVLALSLVGAVALAAPSVAQAATPVAFDSVVPAPVSSTASPGVTYTITSSSAIHADPGAQAIGDQLATILRRSTGFALPVGAAGDIALL